MRSVLVSLVVIAFSASAFAGRGHGGGGYGPGPGHGHGGGGYHHGGRDDSNEVASILSAYTGVLMLTSATACGSGDGCAYRQIILDSKDDAALYIATDGQEKGVKFIRAVELLHKMSPETQSTEYELAVDIINW